MGCEAERSVRKALVEYDEPYIAEEEGKKEGEDWAEGRLNTNLTIFR